MLILKCSPFANFGKHPLLGFLVIRMALIDHRFFYDFIPLITISGVPAFHDFWFLRRIILKRRDHELVSPEWHQ